MKKVLQILVLTLVVLRASAQDPHFSQFYMAPMYLNPALVGAFDGNYRASALFRSQWGAVLQNESVPMYRTYTASIEFRTNKGFGKGDAFGVGASFLGDQAGESKFGYNVGGLAIAYHKSLNKDNTNYLAVGFSSQIYQQTIDYTNLQFGSQWDGAAYNPLLPTNEFLVDNKKLYWDVNAGLLWYMKLGRRSSIYVGMSAYHVNMPNISMLGNNNVKLNIKYTGTGGVEFAINNRFSLQPKFIVLAQGQSIEFIPACDLRILFEEREPQGSNFHFGAMFRMVGGDPNAPWHDKRLNPEAVVLDAGVEWNHITLGVAYVGRWNRRGPQTIYCPKF